MPSWKRKNGGKRRSGKLKKKHSLSTRLQNCSCRNHCVRTRLASGVFYLEEMQRAVQLKVEEGISSIYQMSEINPDIRHSALFLTSNAACRVRVTPLCSFVCVRVICLCVLELLLHIPLQIVPALRFPGRHTRHLLFAVRWQFGGFSIQLDDAVTGE